MKTKPIWIALSVAAASFVVAQEADPYTNSKAKPVAKAEPLNHHPINIEVRYETFSLPLSEAAALSREVLSDSTLYTRILKMIGEGKVEQEQFTVIRVPSGYRATAESISETIYATAYDPPELPNTVGVQISPPRGEDVPSGVPDLGKLSDAPRPEDLDSLRTPATPTEFGTRNLGHTLEVEPTLADDGKTINLMLAPESVLLVGQSVHGQGLSTTKMPEIETQRMNTSANVSIGVPHLLGTVNRPPVSVADPDSANTTWFAFITARTVIPE